MKIAIFGYHAGAHFICKKLLEDDFVEIVYQIGANPAIQPSNRHVPKNMTTLEILEFLDTTELDFVFLTTINFLRNKEIQNKIKEKNIPSCSPSYDLSLLEWSKHKGKLLLNELGIPTAKSVTVDRAKLYETFLHIPRPWVLKFEQDWRAGLQTVIVTDENFKSEFIKLQVSGQHRYMETFGKFTNQHFIIEQFIKGSREYSYHILCNENSWKYIGSARDYKKFKDGDIGINTASMGCYSPVNIHPRVHKFADTILKHLKDIGTPYIGILYLGIMEDEFGEPHVLEINTRPGDPEFQSIVMTLDTDQSLAKILYQTSTGAYIDDVKIGNVNSVSIRIVNSEYVNIVEAQASKDMEKLKPHVNPQLWPELPDIYINFNKNRKLLNSVITTTAETRIGASDKLYNFLKNMQMYDFIYRTDIGYLE
jgi:phosphoribosylamine--glycine ligase